MILHSHPLFLTFQVADMLFRTTPHQSPIRIKTNKDHQLFGGGETLLQSRSPFPIILKSPWHSLMPQKTFGSMPCPIDLGSALMARCPTRCGSRHGRNSLPHISIGFIVRLRQFSNQLAWFNSNPESGSLPQPLFIRMPSAG